MTARRHDFSMATPHLFVYGLLMRGLHLHHHLGDAELVGAGRTPGRLYDLGGYPGLLPAVEPGDWVRGELYRLDRPDARLRRLDRLEGYRADDPQSPYVRELCPVLLDDGTEHRAWVYRFTDAGRAPAERVADGDYRASLRRAGARPS